jgi:hypothetical protein
MQCHFGAQAKCLISEHMSKDESGTNDVCIRDADGWRPLLSKNICSPLQHIRRNGRPLEAGIDQGERCFDRVHDLALSSIDVTDLSTPLRLPPGATFLPPETQDENLIGGSRGRSQCGAPSRIDPSVPWKLFGAFAVGFRLDWWELTCRYRRNHLGITARSPHNLWASRSSLGPVDI